MKLLVGFLGQKASTNWVQLGHRKTAIEYALAGICQVSRAMPRLRARRLSQQALASSRW